MADTSEIDSAESFLEAWWEAVSGPERSHLLDELVRDNTNPTELERYLGTCEGRTKLCRLNRATRELCKSRWHRDQCVDEIAEEDASEEDRRFIAQAIAFSPKPIGKVGKAFVRPGSVGAVVFVLKDVPEIVVFAPDAGIIYQRVQMPCAHVIWNTGDMLRFVMFHDGTMSVFTLHNGRMIHTSLDDDDYRVKSYEDYLEAVATWDPTGRFFVYHTEMTRDSYDNWFYYPLVYDAVLDTSHEYVLQVTSAGPPAIAFDGYRCVIADIDNTIDDDVCVDMIVIDMDTKAEYPKRYHNLGGLFGVNVDVSDEDDAGFWHDYSLEMEFVSRTELDIRMIDTRGDSSDGVLFEI